MEKKESHTQFLPFSSNHMVEVVSRRQHRSWEGFQSRLEPDTQTVPRKGGREGEEEGEGEGEGEGE